MKVTHPISVSVAAAVIALAGCSPEGGDEGRVERETSSYAEPRPGEEGRRETGTPARSPVEQSQQPAVGESRREDTGPGRPGQPGTSGTPSDVATTEFAALDTDSDGVIARTEWPQEATGSMTFERLDSDGNGMIDREEFQKATREEPAQAPTETQPGSTSDPEQ